MTVKYSNALIEQHNLIEARMYNARLVLEMDIKKIALHCGFDIPTDDDINYIIDCLPKDVLYKELAARM